MKKYMPGQFIERFAEMAADSDYSGRTKLQGVTQDDIQAAAWALWWHTRRQGRDCDELYEKLDDRIVIDAMLAQERRYADDGELVSDEFQEFWDAVDDARLTFGLREQIRNELTGKFLAAKREQGYAVVENGAGIWLFKFEG